MATDPTTEAFGTLTDKIGTYGAAVAGLVVAGIVVTFGLKWLKRGASKA